MNWMEQEDMEREEMEQEEDLLQWIVPPDRAGERLDKCLSEWMKDASRTQIQQWIKEGRVLVNEKTAKPNTKLAEGDMIEVAVPPPVEADVVPRPIPLDVVYEDGDVIVVNKPRGMVVHPAPGHLNDTLVNGLLYHCKDLSGINGQLRPGIVHRIDKDTSGLLMVAKNDRAHRHLADQLKAHSVNRKYIALVHGLIAHDVGTVDAPIGRDPKNRKLFTVTDQNGKPAVTHFKVLERFRRHTLLELSLETGRTHQIRVHMKFIGHPLVGDPLYGSGDGKYPIAGQALHAAVLGFIHPTTGERMDFEAPLPKDMENLLHMLRSE